MGHIIAVEANLKEVKDKKIGKRVMINLNVIKFYINTVKVKMEDFSVNIVHDNCYSATLGAHRESDTILRNSQSEFSIGCKHTNHNLPNLPQTNVLTQKQFYKFKHWTTFGEAKFRNFSWN